MQSMGTFWKKHQHHIRQDFLASIVVFLVALPLCLGIALACGLPPALGLISGIIGGLVVGYFSGCPLQVTGPAAGLISVVAEIVPQFGLQGFGTIVFLAGLLQIAIGSLRWGKWFRAVSPAVLQGMLAGIGILIFASQFHVMFDVSPQTSGVGNLLAIPHTLFKGFQALNTTSHHLAAALGVMTILILVVWKSIPKLSRILPAPLVAVVSAVVISSMLNLPVNYIQAPDNLWQVLSWPGFHVQWPLLFDQRIWIYAVTVAFVASAETLMSASVVDLMHGRQHTRYDQEIQAQGIGNFLAGFVGALPVTGVIVRSAANVQAGALTRLSAMLHGLWILGLVIFVPQFLEMIPTSSLAAILVYTGYRLIDPQAIKHLATIGRSELVIYFLTMYMVVTTSLVEGIIVGILASAIKLLHVHSYFNVILARDESQNRTTLDLFGSASFINLPKLVEILDAIPPGSELHVLIDHLHYIDHACLEILVHWEEQHTQTGGKLILEWDDLTRKIAMPTQSTSIDSASVLNAVRSCSKH